MSSNLPQCGNRDPALNPHPVVGIAASAAVLAWAGSRQEILGFRNLAYRIAGCCSSACRGVGPGEFPSRRPSIPSNTWWACVGERRHT
uniref:Uncharacterized protein n=1 Tax=Leersia perrieri TaxID=77586 RepID=A0A0D9X179_9ORYZ